MIIQASAFQQGAHVVERNAAVDVRQCPIDDLLELRGAEEASAGEREQVPPRLS